jgi:endonuclease/exonuclease/phosphatase family metal-dependent hydrolase
MTYARLKNILKCLLFSLVIISAQLLTGCASPKPTPVSVMSYNIHIAKGTDRKLDLDRIAQVIRQSNADLVSLQEVDKNSSRTKFTDQAKLLAQSLDMNYVFAPAVETGTPENPSHYGIAILSRFTIKSSQKYLLAVAPSHEQRVCLATVIEINGTEYNFLATHLDHKKTEMRLAQVRDVLAAADKTKGPVIIAGDFNCLPPIPDQDDARRDHSRPVSMVLEKYQSAFDLAGSGNGATFSKGRKIDYIFVSPDLAQKVKNARVIRDDLTKVASDHLPLIAELEL